MILACPRLTRWELRAVDALSRFRRRGIRYSGSYPSWREAGAAAGGWDDAEILRKVAAGTAKVIRGEAAAERDSVMFDTVEYAYPVMAALLRAALENAGRLRVLDYGGSLGSSYHQFRSFAPPGIDLQWYVVEQENFVRRGHAEFQTPVLRFCFTVDEVARQAQPDVALLSSTLQYLDDPSATLEQLAACGSRYLILDRTPLSGAAKDCLTVQYVPPSIYEASYACRIFSHELLMALLERYWRLECEFPSPDGWACVGSLYFRYGGMLLRRKS